MRSLIATVVLFCVMILAATLNFLYVNRVADEMTNLATSLPSPTDSTCVEKAASLCRKWEKNAPIVGLTVGFSTVDKLSEHCQTLLSCAEVGDVYGYYSTLTLLKDSIDDVRRLEKLSIEKCSSVRIFTTVVQGACRQDSASGRSIGTTS